MTSGVMDYYYDKTNWLYYSVLGSTRDLEPLEYLSHMNHSFLFAPGTPNRAAYSTNGFSLVGLALAGLFNLSDWAALDQRQLAWGEKVFKDDATLFATRRRASEDAAAPPQRPPRRSGERAAGSSGNGLGWPGAPMALPSEAPQGAPSCPPRRGTCLKYPMVAKQYASQPRPVPAGAPPAPPLPFFEISNHSCLNSWTGGNIAARPLDVARFTHAVFTQQLLSQVAPGPRAAPATVVLPAPPAAAPPPSPSPPSSSPPPCAPPPSSLRPHCSR